MGHKIRKGTKDYENRSHWSGENKIGESTFGEERAQSEKGKYDGGQIEAKCQS